MYARTAAASISEEEIAMAEDNSKGSSWGLSGRKHSGARVGCNFSSYKKTLQLVVLTTTNDTPTGDHGK